MMKTISINISVIIFFKLIFLPSFAYSNDLVNEMDQACAKVMRCFLETETDLNESEIKMMETFPNTFCLNAKQTAYKLDSSAEGYKLVLECVSAVSELSCKSLYSDDVHIDACDKINEIIPDNRLAKPSIDDLELLPDEPVVLEVFINTNGYDWENKYKFNDEIIHNYESSELYIPVDKEFRLIFTSKDIVRTCHDSKSLKIDLIPGFKNKKTFLFREIGALELKCFRGGSEEKIINSLNINIVPNEDFINWFSKTLNEEN